MLENYSIPLSFVISPNPGEDYCLFVGADAQADLHHKLQAFKACNPEVPYAQSTVASVGLRTKMTTVLIRLAEEPMKATSTPISSPG